MFPPLKWWGTNEGDAMREKKPPTTFAIGGQGAMRRALNDAPTSFREWTALVAGNRIVAADEARKHLISSAVALSPDRRAVPSLNIAPRAVSGAIRGDRRATGATLRPRIENAPNRR